MNESLQARLERLEVLHSEQDYAMQTLNDTVARQQQEIGRLNQDLGRLRQQLQSLSPGPGESTAAIEKPPHY